MKKLLIPGHVENVVINEHLEIGALVMNPYLYTDMVEALQKCETDARAAIVVMERGLRAIKINGKQLKVGTYKKKSTLEIEYLNPSSINMIPGVLAAKVSRAIMEINTLTEDEKKS